MIAKKYRQTNFQNPSGELNDVAARLREAIGQNKTTSSWAKEVGIAGSTLNGILEKGATPTTKNLLKIAATTDISLNWLLAARGPKSIHGNTGLPLKEDREEFTTGQTTRREEQFLYPRSVQLMNQLGIPPEARDQMAEEVAFQSQWLKLRLQVDPERTMLLRVKGDGMVPTLRDGDLVMVDVRETRVRQDAIYALQFKDGLAIKRVQRDLDGSLFVHSDNADYERIIVNADNVGNLRVIGLVVWIGRAL